MSPKSMMASHMGLFESQALLMREAPRIRSPTCRRLLTGTVHVLLSSLQLVHEAPVLVTSHRTLRVRHDSHALGARLLTPPLDTASETRKPIFTEIARRYEFRG